MCCAGDVPTLETLAAVSILRKRVPNLKIRVVNIVDLMKLSTTHPHGLSDKEFDSIFTTNKPVLFNFHSYIHVVQNLVYSRTNRNFHVKGYKEEGTITTPFDMTVMNEIDRFHLVMDVCDLVTNDGKLNGKAYLRQDMQRKLVEHKEYIQEYGVDMSEISEWTWDL